MTRSFFLKTGVGAVAATLSIAMAQGQVVRPQVAPPGREDIYRRTWDIQSTIKGGTLAARWMADGNSFWYAEGSPDNTVIWKFDSATRTRTPLFDTPRLTTGLKTLLGRELPYRGLPFDTFSFLDRERVIRFSFGGEEFTMPLASYEITRVAAPSRQEAARATPRIVREPAMGSIVSEILSPDRRWLLGEKDFNLYVRSTYDGREVLLTSDGIKSFEWRIGGYNYVRPMSARWSPDSGRVAVLKYDERDVVNDSAAPLSQAERRGPLHSAFEGRDADRVRPPVHRRYPVGATGEGAASRRRGAVSEYVRLATRWLGVSLLPHQP